MCTSSPVAALQTNALSLATRTALASCAEDAVGSGSLFSTTFPSESVGGANRKLDVRHICVLSRRALGSATKRRTDATYAPCRPLRDAEYAVGMSRVPEPLAAADVAFAVAVASCPTFFQSEKEQAGEMHPLRLTIGEQKNIYIFPPTPTQVLPPWLKYTIRLNSGPLSKSDHVFGQRGINLATHHLSLIHI